MRTHQIRLANAFKARETRWLLGKFTHHLPASREEQVPEYVPGEGTANEQEDEEVPEYILGEGAEIEGEQVPKYVPGAEPMEEEEDPRFSSVVLKFLREEKEGNQDEPFV
ncbi:hypothetical protein PIB30_093384 [Stylosanthes scabra]|uniref:Uncharacterized protein n=1 Tax=Stylosanthes scabra TaxID=79078 RepID=A0ABU6SVH5_9FABA|nr:hypothetical protein [Stylosanthes scabra]